MVEVENCIFLAGECIALPASLERCASAAAAACCRLECLAGRDALGKDAGESCTESRAASISESRESSMQPCSAQATRAVEEACVARCCVTSACARKLSSCSSAPTRACRLLNSHASFMYKLSSMTEHPHPSSLTLPFRCVRPRRHTCHVHLSTGLSMRKMMAIRLKAHEAAQGRLLGVPPP